MKGYRSIRVSVIRSSLFAAIAICASASAATKIEAGSKEALAPVFNVLTEDRVHEVVKEHVLARLAEERAESTEGADGEERVEVHPRWQGDILFDEPANGPFELKVVPLSDKPFRGPTLVRVEISQGKQMLRALTVTVDTRLYREVIVMTRTVRRGTQLTPEMVELAERDVTSLKHGYFAVFEDLADLQVKRPIGAGDIVSHSHVKPIPLVHRGDEVVMTIVSRHMQLATFGLALQDGGAGERIRVKNVESGKIVQGHVVEDGSVRIGL